MQTTTLSSKGQVIIPKTLRVARRWGPGTQLEWHETPEGVLLRPASAPPKVVLREGLAAIRKRLAYTGPVVSLAEMDAEVLRQAASRSPIAPRASKMANAAKPVLAPPKTIKRSR